MLVSSDEDLDENYNYNGDRAPLESSTKDNIEDFLPNGNVDDIDFER